MTNKVLFINHKQEKCGVYQYGRNTANILADATFFDFVYVECSGMAELESKIKEHEPCAIIYNYHVSTLGWVRKPLRTELRHLAIQHEPHQPVPSWMDATISQNPLDPWTKNFFSVGRILHEYTGTYPTNSILTIGTFGFGLGGKGYDRLVDMVGEEFSEAHIRMHIPYAHYGDAAGQQARHWASLAEERAKGYPDITLSIDHEWFTTEDLLFFLAGNDLNAFIYDDMARGTASVLDFALSVNRPLAITGSLMFEHVWRQVPEILVEHNSLQDILRRDTQPLRRLKWQWSPQMLIADYEKIVGTVWQA
jgi:hypothetical protein